MAPAYKLSYFDIRGLAECSRILFALGGVEYEDHRYPFSIVDGKYITGHTDDKAAGVLDMNLGKVPLLYIDGKAAVGQSKAIERYLAKAFGFMGSNPVEEAQVDMWIEHLRDISDAYSKAKSAPEDPACPGVSGAAKFVAEELPGHLAKLSAVAELTGTPGYAVGNKMSLAGLRLYLLATDGMVPSGGVAEVAAAFAAQPRLQAIIDNVAANEKLKAWLAKRPVTPF